MSKNMIHSLATLFFCKFRLAQHHTELRQVEVDYHSSGCTHWTNITLG